MRHIALSVFLALTMTAAVSPAFAAGAGAKAQASTTPAYYRYRNAQGVLVMERAIPPEYVGKGYQVLNSFMQVIEDVPPAKILTEEERRAKGENDASNSRKDAELRKLYSAPQDAERLRDRQLEALGLKIDHARGQMNQAASQRKTEVEQAARTERSGKQVPQHARDNIDRLTRQVNVHEQEIKTLEAEQQRMRAEFEPVIARLRVIYPNKVDPAAAAAGAALAAPVAAQTPAPTPVAPAPAKPLAPASAVPPAVAKPAPAPVAVPVAKPAAPPPAPPAPVVQAPVKPAAPPAVVPVAKPVALTAAPTAAPKPAPQPVAPVAAKPVPVKQAGTVPEPTIKPKPPEPPSTVPPVAPVSKSKEKASKTTSSESEKATAKEKAKEMLDLEEEPRSAGGLRPTGF